MVGRTMKYIATFLLAVCVVACQTSPAPSGFRPAGPPKPVTFGGGNGLSYATAVVVHASDKGSGVKSEYDYIRAHYPGHHFISQALAFDHGKSYDIMTFTSADRKKHVLYFDISEYLGRL